MHSPIYYITEDIHQFKIESGNDFSTEKLAELFITDEELFSEYVPHCDWFELNTTQTKGWHRGSWDPMESFADYDITDRGAVIQVTISKEQLIQEQKNKLAQLTLFVQLKKDLLEKDIVTTDFLEGIPSEYVEELREQGIQPFSLGYDLFGEKNYGGIMLGNGDPNYGLTFCHLNEMKDAAIRHYQSSDEPYSFYVFKNIQGDYHF